MSNYISYLWNEMELNAPSYVIYIVRRLNGSLIFFESDAMLEDRARRIQLSASAEKNPKLTQSDRSNLATGIHDVSTRDRHSLDSSYLTNDVAAVEPKRRNLLRGMAWLCRVTRTNYIWYLVIIFHLFIFVCLVGKGVLYSFLSKKRNRTTGKYENYWLRILESCWVISYSVKIPNGDLLDKVVAISLSQFIFLRIKALHDIYKLASEEKIRLSTMQLDFTSLGLLRGTLKDWFQLFSDNLHLFKYFSKGEKSENKCEQEFRAGMAYNRKLREFSRRLKGSAPIDRFFFYNQVDFSDSVRKLKLKPLDKLHSDDELLEGDLVEGTMLYGFDEWQRSLNKPIDSKGNLTVQKPKDSVKSRPMRSFPEMRISPAHLGVIGFVLVGLIPVGISFALLLMIVGWFLIWLYNIGEGSEYLAFLNAFWLNFSPSQKLAYFLYDDLFTSLICPFAFFDYALIMIASSFVRARAGYVEQHLARLNKLHEGYKRRFKEKQQSQRARSGDEFQTMRQASMHSTDSDMIDSIIRARKTVLLLSVGSKSLNQRLEKYSRVWSSAEPSDILDSMSHIPHKMKEMQPQGDPELEAFKQVKLEFRSEINQLDLQEFNESLDHLLLLVEALQHEFRDYRRRLTPYININIIHSCITSAAVAAALSKMPNLGCLPYISTAFFYGTVPLLSTMLSSILFAHSYESIYKKLIPLLINELSLIRHESWENLYNVCEYLAPVENRTYLLLWDLPLTTATSLSIFGWIASICTIIQGVL